MSVAGSHSRARRSAMTKMLANPCALADSLSASSWRFNPRHAHHRGLAILFYHKSPRRTTPSSVSILHIITDLSSTRACQSDKLTYPTRASSRAAMDTPYEAMDHAELKHLCTGRGLRRGGTKADLIKRLYKADRDRERRRSEQQEPIRHQSRVKLWHLSDPRSC